MGKMKKKTGDEGKNIDSAYPVFYPGWFPNAAAWLCVAGDVAAGAEGLDCGQVFGNFHAHSRLISRYALSWSIKHLPAATLLPGDHVISSTAFCHQVGHDSLELRRVDWALQTEPAGFSVFVLLPRTEKHSALSWNVVGIVGFGGQSSPAQAASGHKRGHAKGNAEGAKRKKPRGLGHEKNFDPDDDGERNEENKKHKGPGKSEPANELCGLYLACPFFLLDLVRHWRCLGKYTLKRYSDVKLHMLRCHAFEGNHYCRNCGEEWSTMDPWADHIRAGCSVRPLPGVDNLDPQERNVFKAKEFKKESKSFGERDKYTWMWTTFFRGHPLPQSPYVQDTIADSTTLFRRNGESRLRAWLNSRPSGEPLDPNMIIDIYEGATVEAPPRFRRIPSNVNSNTAQAGPAPRDPAIPSSSTPRSAPGPLPAESQSPTPGPGRVYWPARNPSSPRDPQVSPAPRTLSSAMGPGRAGFASDSPGNANAYPVSNPTNIIGSMNVPGARYMRTANVPNQPVSSRILSVPPTGRGAMPSFIRNSPRPPTQSPEQSQATQLHHFGDDPPPYQAVVPVAPPGYVLEPRSDSLAPHNSLNAVMPTDLADGSFAPDYHEYLDYVSQDSWIRLGSLSDLPSPSEALGEFLASNNETAVTAGNGGDSSRPHIPLGGDGAVMAPGGTINPRHLREGRPAQEPA